MGIRWRLLILTLGVAIPLVVVGVIDLRGVWSVSRDQLDDSVKQQAELAAVAFERWMDAQRQPLTTVAAIVSARGTEALELGENLRYAVQTRPHWIDIQIVGAAGESLLAQPAGREPLPPALVEHLLEEVRRRNSWTVVTDRTKDESRPIFIVASPTKEGGAVVARLDGAAMGQLFGGVHLSDRSVIGIFDSQGRVLYRRQTTETPVDTNVSGTPLLNVLGSGRKNDPGGNQSAVIEIESPYDGVRRVYGIARAGATDCVVIVGIPSAALYEPARRQLTRHLYFSLLALCSAIIAVLVVTRSIVLPLRRLRDAAQAVGRGHLKARAPSKGKDEINELGAVFNTMADQIAEREEKLKELDRLKSEFVSSVSHELRTPLTTIKTLTHVLQRGGQTEDERAEYLETIAAECDRQIDLVLNLLDLSRIESGAYKVTFSRVNIAEVVNACLVAGRHAADARNQSLAADVPGNLPDAVADERALRRVLSSLIENALKYTAEGGRVVVQARTTAKGEVAISVKDNGCGIKGEDLPHIFEKFFRGRPAAEEEAAARADGERSEAPGVGLGLYLTRSIVEHMGGRVSAENNADGGASFTVHLPSWPGDDGSETVGEEGTSVEAIAGD